MTDQIQKQYWGINTQRNMEHMPMSGEKIPAEFIHALGLQKKAAALANIALGFLPRELGNAIVRAAGEVYYGQHDDQFPLSAWQSGSANQTHMNVIEVIATRANEILGCPDSHQSPVHPIDHVTLGQSSGDSVPTAIHIAAIEQIRSTLLPGLIQLYHSLHEKEEKWRDVVKIGRSHLQDGMPMTFGQEFSGYVRQILVSIERIKSCLPQVYEIPQGGSGIGTGLNVPHGFDKAFCAALATLTGLPYTPAPNKFEAIANHDSLVYLSGALNTVSASLNKIANDIKLLSSGPHTGFGELRVQINEPGSTILPGRINPTEAEAMCMICAQVMGNHTTISIAGSNGQLEMNAYKPVIILNLLQSIRLLGDGAHRFALRQVIPLELNSEKVARNVPQSAMLATALTPLIGYDRATRIARRAIEQHITLKEAAKQIDPEVYARFDEWIKPEEMIHSGLTQTDLSKA